MLSLKKWLDTIYTSVKAPISRPYEMGNKKKLLILANGPSAGEFWNKDEVRAAFSSYDIMCMNDAIFRKKEEIFKLRPRFFILMDPALFGDCPNENQAAREHYGNVRKNVHEVLEKINWKANIITTYHGEIALQNANLTVLRLNGNIILPKKEKYYRLYKKNLANPGIDTVLEGALFWGVTYGYKEIALLGTEFTLFKYIEVDENNVLFNFSNHFYKEVLKDSNAKAVTKERFKFEGSAVAYFLHRMANCFTMFYELNKYAEFYGCKIYNYTEDSMIDAFERRRLKIELHSDLDRKSDEA